MLRRICIEFRRSDMYAYELKEQPKSFETLTKRTSRKEGRGSLWRFRHAAQSVGHRWNLQPISYFVGLRVRAC